MKILFSIYLWLGAFYLHIGKDQISVIFQMLLGTGELGEKIPLDKYTELSCPAFWSKMLLVLCFVSALKQHLIID